MDERHQSIHAIATQFADRPGALLPVLHGVQERFGYLPEETVAVVARVLNLSRAEVHGVISFYHLLRRSPPGKRTIYVCRSEACTAAGGRALVEHAKSRLGIQWHETTEDGRFSLEPIYCLGNCACSPAVMIDRTLHGRVSGERFDQLIAPTDENPRSG